MVQQVNIQDLSEIKNFIEENNTVLRAAIHALEIFSNQAPSNQAPQAPAPQAPAPQAPAPQAPQIPQIPQIPQPSEQRNYPGYTTPPKFGFM